jgi:hypothetical protein
MSESFHYKDKLKVGNTISNGISAAFYKPTLQEQIDYIKENREGLQKVIEDTPDVKKTSRTIEMLRAIEENLHCLRLLEEVLKEEKEEVKMTLNK